MRKVNRRSRPIFQRIVTALFGFVFLIATSLAQSGLCCCASADAPASKSDHESSCCTDEDQSAGSDSVRQQACAEVSEPCSCDKNMAGAEKEFTPAPMVVAFGIQDNAPAIVPASAAVLQSSQWWQSASVAWIQTRSNPPPGPPLHLLNSIFII
ncbi:hypothetical protein BH09SUM1_BH09SUM1_25930 [soil metagenome]